MTYACASLSTKPVFVSHTQNYKCSENEADISKMFLFPIAWCDEVIHLAYA